MRRISNVTERKKCLRIKDALTEQFPSDRQSLFQNMKAFSSFHTTDMKFQEYFKTQAVTLQDSGYNTALTQNEVCTCTQSYPSLPDGTKSQGAKHCNSFPPFKNKHSICNSKLEFPYCNPYHHSTSILAWCRVKLVIIKQKLFLLKIINCFPQSISKRETKLVFNCPINAYILQVSTTTTNPNRGRSHHTLAILQPTDCKILILIPQTSYFICRIQTTKSNQVAFGILPLHFS